MMPSPRTERPRTRKGAGRSRRSMLSSALPAVVFVLAFGTAGPSGAAEPAPVKPAPPSKPTSAKPASSASWPGKEAFDWAFRFASAIQSDPKDMARAQENVVDDRSEEHRVG